MSSSAIVMMFVGIIVIWGGLVASIWNAVKVSKQK
ncbi:methionine/alanine import family NSS transporter small subunit [Desulfosporosinus nitroreducens]|nr:methionine/alanine import family NSS transporter small subunit [Desulfosporosinus nitroreducens]MCO1604149.1 methionine/alanine import family NSS transporter small subunit [Desulfosporosinus nitroreducens]